MSDSSRDQLFLLRPSFADAKAGAGLFHCPFSARIEGLLSFYPFLRSRMDVHYLDFSRPRTPIVDLIGPDHQSCPVLVLAPANADAPGATRSPTGRSFISDSAAISTYFAHAHGVPAPHP
jgi:hypothetical protein